MQITKKNYINALVFLYIAFVFLWMDDFFAVQRLYLVGKGKQGNFEFFDYIKYAIFIGQYFLAITTIWLAGREKTLWGIVFLVVVWFFTTIDLVVFFVQGQYADLQNIAVFNASIANYGDATQAYADEIISSVIKTGVLFIPLLFGNIFCKYFLKQASKQASKQTSKYLLLALIALIIIYVTSIIKRGDPASMGFPKGFLYGFGTIALIANNVNAHENKIETSSYNKSNSLREEIYNIVVIVDESIEYAALQKNAHLFTKNIVNLERTFSAANCSASSNYILRRGFWERSGKEALDIVGVDSLFKIAKRNHFVTTFIDNQGIFKGFSPLNYVSPEEVDSIDHIVTNKGAAYTRDAEAIPQILNTLNAGENFIFVQKTGAHFPYATTLSPAERTEDKFSDYAKSVKINAADFIVKLADQVPPNTLIFYTSDHGQELNARTTHCNSGDISTSNEYSVPFLLITSNQKVLAAIKKNLPQLMNNLTHIEFSESIRNMMGEEISGANSIFKYTPPKFEYCGLYGDSFSFFGRPISCKKLGQAQLLREPL